MPGTGLSGLVAQAYEAACDSARMSGFVENTAEYFGAQQAALTICPISHPDDLLPVTHGVSADEIRALYTQQSVPESIYALLQSTQNGETITLEGYERPAENQDLPSRRRTDVQLVDVNILGGVVTSDENNRCDLLLFRDKSRGGFSPSEQDALRELMRYLRRAIDLNKRFVKIFVEHKTALSVLDNAPRSIMILGMEGQVTYQNNSARQLLAKNDGLCLEQKLFTVGDPEARQEVEAFLDKARTSDEPDLDAQRLMIVVRRDSGGAPFKLVMYKLPFDPQQAALDSSQSLAVALVYDPSTMNHLNMGLLHNFYNLTQAESALAQELYEGRTLPEASVDLGISVNTSRTQLRSIFKKVGVHSQAALLQELAKSFIHA